MKSPGPRVLAVDPSLRCSGYGVLEPAPRGASAVAWGVIPTPAPMPVAKALAHLHASLVSLIHEHRPDCLALESIIYVQNMRTAILLGGARGVVLLAAAQQDLPIFEYAPRLVKMAVVGRGQAAKPQVAFMIRALLGLTETPPPDAADALAVGLTHLQRTTRL